MKVVAEIADMESDQEFFSDVASVTFVSIKSTVLGWPGHMQLIAELKACRKTNINYSSLRLLFPSGTWKRKSIISFLHHYTRYEFMAVGARKESSEQVESVRRTVAEIEVRLSVMLGMPIPNAAERTMENKRLDMIGQVERDSRAICNIKSTNKNKEAQFRTHTDHQKNRQLCPAFRLSFGNAGKAISCWANPRSARASGFKICNRRRHKRTFYD